MKKLFTVLFFHLLLVTSTLKAQSLLKDLDLYFAMSLHANIRGMQHWSENDSFSGRSFALSGGVQCEKWNLGIGFSQDIYRLKPVDVFSIPKYDMLALFLEFSYFPAIEKKTSPFISTQLGHGFGIQSNSLDEDLLFEEINSGGLHAGMKLGLRIKYNRGTHLILYSGYAFQKTSSIYIDSEQFYNYLNISFHRLTFGFSVSISN